MTFAAADPVPSGRPCPVVQVDDRAPSMLDDFAGRRTVVLDCYGGRQAITGLGAYHGEFIRFHEKDVATDKDVRVWRITPASTSGFAAEAIPAGQE